MRFFDELFQAHGYLTLQTMTGDNVMQLLREHMPDLVVMDIQISEMSGWELTKMIKADDELKDNPVIAVTTFAMQGDEENIRSAGFHDLLAKPIPMAIMMDTITKHLN